MVTLLVPKNILAEELSAEFKKELNTDGKLAVNSIESKDDFEAGVLLYEYRFYF